MTEATTAAVVAAIIPHRAGMSVASLVVQLALVLAAGGVGYGVCWFARYAR